MARDCERASMTVDVSPETAAEIAARLDTGDAVEPISALTSTPQPPQFSS